MERLLLKSDPQLRPIRRWRRFARFGRLGLLHKVSRESCEMQTRRSNNSYARGAVQALVVILWQVNLLFGASAPPASPTNIFAPASTPADSIFGLSLFVLAVTGAIFVLVFGLLLYSFVKFRKRKNDA